MTSRRQLITCLVAILVLGVVSVHLGIAATPRLYGMNGVVLAWHAVVALIAGLFAGGVWSRKHRSHYALAGWIAAVLIGGGLTVTAWGTPGELPLVSVLTLNFVALAAASARAGFLTAVPRHVLFRHGLSALFLAAAAVAIWWLLFGWTSRSQAGDLVTLQRSFGKLTTVLVDRNWDGATDARTVCSWSSPFTFDENMFQNLKRCKSYVHDYDFDGAWDLYVHIVRDSDGKPTMARLAADTTADGTLNHRAEVPIEQVGLAIVEINGLRNPDGEL